MFILQSDDTIPVIRYQVLRYTVWYGDLLVTVFVCSVHEYWPTVDLRLVEPKDRRSDLVGEEANLTDRPALGDGVLKK